jgi:hypothetical protein
MRALCMLGAISRICKVENYIGINAYKVTGSNLQYAHLPDVAPRLRFMDVLYATNRRFLGPLGPAERGRV